LEEKGDWAESRSVITRLRPGRLSLTGSQSAKSRLASPCSSWPYRGGLVLTSRHQWHFKLDRLLENPCGSDRPFWGSTHHEHPELREGRYAPGMTMTYSPFWAILRPAGCPGWVSASRLTRYTHSTHSHSDKVWASLLEAHVVHPESPRSMLPMPPLFEPHSCAPGAQVSPRPRQVPDASLHQG
jgi:hypothetical protein